MASDQTPVLANNPSTFTLPTYRAYVFDGAHLRETVPFTGCFSDRTAKARAIGLFLTGPLEVDRMEVWKDSELVFVIDEPPRN